MGKYLTLLGLLWALQPLPSVSSDEFPGADWEIPYSVVQGTAVLATGTPDVYPSRDIFEAKRYVTITAYSSTPEETDDTPFITASGTHVREGVVAANFLPIGTAIKIPELYGDRLFVVEDRMHERNSDKVDIWMPTKAEAKQFGRQTARIVVIR
ncbi:MAG: hypothetical protein Q8Q41_00660 [bacterium]|nr:hypothetical protein [bacterium]